MTEQINADELIARLRAAADTTDEQSLIVQSCAAIEALQAERDALAAKLAELEGQEPVAWYVDDPLWGREYNTCPNMSDNRTGTPLYARPVPAEPVNARLLEALKRAKDSLVAFKFLPGDANRWEASDEENLAAVNSAISAAESAPKAVRLTDEEVASLLADSDKNSSRVPSFFMVEPHKFARAIETAVLAKNGIEVAE